MFEIKKSFEFCASHQLSFADGSIEPLHGHNWKVSIYCKCEELDESGFVVDFVYIEKCIKDKLDHQDLNSVFDFNPTTENIARWICKHIPNCYRVDLQECEGNEASYYE